MNYETVRAKVNVGKGFYGRPFTRFINALMNNDVDACTLRRDGQTVNARSYIQLTRAGIREDEVLELEARVATHQVEAFNELLEELFTVLPSEEHQIDKEFDVADKYGIHARNAALLTRALQQPYIDNTHVRYNGQPFFEVGGIFSLLQNCIGAKRLHVRVKLKNGEEGKAPELTEAIQDALSVDYS